MTTGGYHDYRCEPFARPREQRGLAGGGQFTDYSVLSMTKAQAERHTYDGTHVIAARGFV